MSGPLAFVMPPPGSVPPGSIDNSELADMAALTVKVNATNASASPQDLAATADGQVLTRSGTALTWAALAAADVPYDNAVSGLTAIDVQAAIDEIVAGLGTASAEDYEEGTFTPSVSCASPGDLSLTTSVAAGSYAKLGNYVDIQMATAFNANAYTTASGGVQVSGLPFVPVSDLGGVSDYWALSQAFVSRLTVSSASVISIMGLIQISVGKIVLFESNDASGVSQVQITAFPPSTNSCSIRLSGFYRS